MNKQALHIFAKQEAYFLVASAMFFGLFVSFALQAISSTASNAVLLERLIILLGEFAILVPPLFILKQRKINILDVIPLKPVSPTTIVMAIITVIGVIGVVSVFEVIILPYFPMPEFLKGFERGLTEGGTMGMLFLLLAGGLAAPLVEEFLFRGVLQQSLFYRYGSILPAMIVPTVIFTLFHVVYLFYLPALIELISLALLLGWLMIKTGNLIIPIIVHSIFNLSSFLSMFSIDTDEVMTLADLGPAWIIISVIFTLAGWIYFKNMPVSSFEDVYLIPSLGEKES